MGAVLRFAVLLPGLLRLRPPLCPGQCEGCRRNIAVKKGQCRLCWLQAGLDHRRQAQAHAGRLRAHRLLAAVAVWHEPLGNTGPAPAAPAAEPPRRPAAAGRSWNCALPVNRGGSTTPLGRLEASPTRPCLTRRIACELAETRGWNTRIVIETGRALAVVLADASPET